MTPSRKGNYTFCDNCIHQIKSSNLKYPCTKSHKQVRGDIKYERDFVICLQKETE